MHRSYALYILITSCHIVFADVTFTDPSPGESLPGGEQFSIEWLDEIRDQSAYQLFLYSGSKSSPESLFLISTGTLNVTDYLITIVPVDTGGEFENAYFLGMISTPSSGGNITIFSQRFTLTGMTGQFSNSVLAGLADVNGTDGPASIDDRVADASSSTTLPVSSTAPTSIKPSATSPGTSSNLSSATVTITNSSTPHRSSGISMGAIIGLVIAAIIVLGAFGAGVFFFGLCKGRKTSRQDEQKDWQYPSAVELPQGGHREKVELEVGVQGMLVPKAELEAKARVYELSSDGPDRRR